MYSGENFCEKYWNREKKITEITEGEDGWKITDDSIEIFVTRAQGKLRVYKRSKEHKEPKIIIIVPMFPNLSLQSFSILSELKWLKELIIDEETKSLRENIEIHLLYLNKAFLGILNKSVGEEKQKYFCDYKTGEKIMVDSVLKLNKYRLESIVKRYLIEYIKESVVERKIKVDEIKKIAYWLEKHVKWTDENAVFDGDNKIFDKKEIKITNGIECDDKTSTWEEINHVLDKNIVNERYNFSDVGVPEILGFKNDVEQLKNSKASWKNILHYIEKIANNNTYNDIIIIGAQTFRGVILYDFYIANRIFNEKRVFFGWDSYIPMTLPPIIPSFQYLSILSKSYEYYHTKMYEKIIYNCDGEKGKHTICYLAHYLEYLFKDVLEMFRLRIKGPKCERCRSETIIVKEKCDKCGTEHWMFECTSGWKKHGLCGSFADYLWLSTEIYHTLEKIFLDIPYTFMLAKRKYSPEMPEGATQNEDEMIRKEFSSFEKRLVKDELKKHFEEQYKYIQEKIKNRKIN